MPDDVEIGPEWDPAAHDYGNGSFLPTSEPGRQMALIMGLTALAAFAGIGVCAFYSVGAAAAIEAAPLTVVTVTFTIEHEGQIIQGVQKWCTNGITMTPGQQIVFATIQNQGVGGVAPTVVREILESWGFSKVLNVASLLALAAYNTDLISAWRYPSLGYYYGANIPMPGRGSGGNQTPPGWPGFIGTDPSHPGASGKVCYMVGDEHFCYWVY